MKLRGLELREHRFGVPLDHADPGGAEIEVFAREVRGAAPGADDLPWLVFLQGGPGFECPRPLAADGWLGRAVTRYRVLLVDQRGTGCSTAQLSTNISSVGDADAQARHLAHFRADSIVRDLERIRGVLGVERWTLLGQSFGGFCAVAYLSMAPDSLAAVMITGGLPGLESHADDVYGRTYATLEGKNAALHRRFPALGGTMQRVFERVARGDVRLPSGDPLTLERLQSIGIVLGFQDGAARLYYLFERAFVPGTDHLTRAFLAGVEAEFPFDANPLYLLLHEACYGQGPATRWSAHRLRDDFPRFDARAALEHGDVPFLTGEMVYPWMLEQCAELQALREAGERLAQLDDWPRLYDPAVLESNAVPVAAVVYHDDMFVPVDLSLATATRIRGLTPWVTNEFEHDGLRTDGARVFDRLQEDLRLFEPGR